MKKKPKKCLPCMVNPEHKCLQCGTEFCIEHTPPKYKSIWDNRDRPYAANKKLCKHTITHPLKPRGFLTMRPLTIIGKLKPIRKPSPKFKKKK